MKLLHIMLFSACCLGAFSTARADEGEKRELKIFDEAVFYDGYQQSIIIDADLDDGILRHMNHLYAVKLTDEQLA